MTGPAGARSKYHHVTSCRAAAQLQPSRRSACDDLEGGPIGCNSATSLATKERDVRDDDVSGSEAPALSITRAAAAAARARAGRAARTEGHGSEAVAQREARRALRRDHARGSVTGTRLSPQVARGEVAGHGTPFRVSHVARARSFTEIEVIH